MNTLWIREHCTQDGNLDACSVANILKWIQIRVGYVWTSKFDLNTDTCGRGNFWIQKEEVAESQISGYSWTGPQKIAGNYWGDNHVCQPSDKFSFYEVVRVNTRSRHTFEFMEWLRSPSEPKAICFCQLNGAQHSIAFLTWISSDYFESLLLPQGEITTRSNRMKFRR